MAESTEAALFVASLRMSTAARDMDKRLEEVSGERHPQSSRRKCALSSGMNWPWFTRGGREMDPVVLRKTACQGLCCRPGMAEGGPGD